VVTRAQIGGEAAPEWFLAGTGMAMVERSARGSAARIVYPGAGVVIALDPDIPEAQQRLLLSAAPASRGLTWQLEGATLGPADKAFAWRPVAGRHRLRLVGASGQVVDEVTFEVRGGGRSTTAPPVASTAAAARVALGGVLSSSR